jgi:hypothetical protein
MWIPPERLWFDKNQRIQVCTLTQPGTVTALTQRRPAAGLWLRGYRLRSAATRGVLDGQGLDVRSVSTAADGKLDKHTMPQQ